MDLRRGNCPMTVLMLSLQVPSESELSSVPFKLTITPFGANLFLNRKSLKNSEKFLLVPLYRDKILLAQRFFYILRIEI